MCQCIPRSRKQSKVNVMEQMNVIEQMAPMEEEGHDYMGLQLTKQFVQKNLPDYAIKPPDVSPRPRQRMLIAMQQRMPSPSEAAAISGWIDEESEPEETGQGVATREVKVTSEDNTGKIGLRIRHVNKGLYIAFVHQDSPAALAGLRFGDQILKINNQDVVGWDTAKALKVLNQVSGELISFTVKDRPYEKIFRIPKNHGDSIGLVFKNGKIKSLVENSSAERNGVPINHQIIEYDGQNVVGMKDARLQKILDTEIHTITITIMPSILYDHIVKCLGDSIMETSTDRSIPDV